MILEHDSADDGDHRRHASQRTDNQRRAPPALVEVEHVSDCCQGQALPGRHSEALDEPAGEEVVVVILLGADDADDGPQCARGGCEKELRALSILLGEDGDQWASWQTFPFSKNAHINWQGVFGLTPVSRRAEADNLRAQQPLSE